MRIATPWIIAPLLLALAAGGCAKKSNLAPPALGSTPAAGSSQVAGKGSPNTLAATSARVSDAMTIKPKVVKPADAVALDNMPAGVNPEVYVAAARMAEQTGNFAAAEQNYQKALRAAPKNLQAQVGYARLQDRQGNYERAVQMYRQAAQAHPESALVLNDLGLCLARKGDLPGASEAVRRAIALAPKNARYRNNLAAVLVSQGRHAEALNELAAVHEPGPAHYNLAYLLLREGEETAARAQLEQAVAADPSLAPARELLASLGDPAPAEVSVANHTAPPRRTPPVEAESPAPSKPAQQGPVLTAPGEPDFTPPARYERNAEPLLRRTPPTASREAAPRFPVSLAIPQVEASPSDQDDREVVYPEIRLPRSLTLPEAKLTTHVE